MDVIDTKVPTCRYEVELMHPGDPLGTRIIRTAALAASITIAREKDMQAVLSDDQYRTGRGTVYLLLGHGAAVSKADPDHAQVGQVAYGGSTLDPRTRIRKSIAHSRHYADLANIVLITPQRHSLLAIRPEILEDLFLRGVQCVGRYAMKNDVNVTYVDLSPAQRREAELTFASVAAILSANGIDAFTPGSRPRRQPLFTMTLHVGGVPFTSRAYNHGATGMTVLGGATGPAVVSDTTEGPAIERRRLELVAQGRAEYRNDSVAVFRTTALVRCESPRDSASVIAGNPRNGWDRWRSGGLQLRQHLNAVAFN